MSKIILASQSPRRRELLEKMGVEFSVVPSTYVENLDDTRSPEEVAIELALGKAEDVAHDNPRAYVIGADSIVGLHGRQLGKPRDIDEARHMLTNLAGSASTVTTGVAIVNIAKSIRATASATTIVHFKPESPDTARNREAYLATGDWKDKAAGYGIQSGADVLIDTIEGEYNTVVGLPTRLLTTMLDELGIAVNTNKPHLPSLLQGKQAFLSDLDGTLIDSVDLIRHGQYETIRQHLTSIAIPAQGIPDFTTFVAYLNQAVGGSAHHTLWNTVSLIYADKPHYLDRIDADALHDGLSAVQDALAKQYIKAYDGVPALLHQLGNAGQKVAFITSGTRHHVVRNVGIALAELGLSELYQDTAKTDQEKLLLLTQALQTTYNIPELTVVTADDTPHHKPDPDCILIAMERLGVAPENCVLFGDHAVDMQTGSHAGLTTLIGVSHGFSDHATLQANGATQVVHSIDELLAL